MTYVKNASGTSRWSKPSTGESSWLDYWEKKTGKKATRCGATDCHSTGTLVGAHVQKVFGGNELYITSLHRMQSAKRQLLGWHRTGQSTQWTVTNARYATPKVLRSGIGRSPQCFNLTPTIMRKEIHIVSNPNRGGWDAKRPNADRASKHFDTKKEAMEWGRDLARGKD